MSVFLFFKMQEHFPEYGCVSINVSPSSCSSLGKDRGNDSDLNKLPPWFASNFVR